MWESTNKSPLIKQMFSSIRKMYKCTNVHLHDIIFITVSLCVTRLLWFVLCKQAEALRLDCKCPPLKSRDPRTAIADLQKLVAQKNVAREKDAASTGTSTDITVNAPRDSVTLPRPKS